MFIAKVQTVSLAVAACLIVAGTGVVVAKQLATTSSAPTSPAQPQITAPVHLPSPTLTEPTFTVAEAQPAQPPSQPEVEPGSTSTHVFASRSVVQNGLEITVAAEKLSWPANQSVNFVIRLRNVSDEAFYLWDASRTAERQIAWTVKFSDWVVRYPLLPMGKAPRIVPESSKLLPGAMIEVPVRCAAVWYSWDGPKDETIVRKRIEGDPDGGTKSLTESTPPNQPQSLQPGRYNLVVQRRFQWLKAGPGKRYELDAPFWEGEIASDPLPIEITASTP